ncbi:MAG: hypothetical protein OEU35_12855, partial [Desulfuromonadales bacterium]|nr:hypothetical protein [Desulfuromonadales bacterium]
MEGFKLSPGRRVSQLSEGMHNVAGHAIENERQVRRIAEADKLRCPLLVKSVMCFVDLGVRVVQVLDRAH